MRSGCLTRPFVVHCIFCLFILFTFFWESSYCGLRRFVCPEEADWIVVSAVPQPPEANGPHEQESWQNMSAIHNPHTQPSRPQLKPPVGYDGMVQR